MKRILVGILTVFVLMSMAVSVSAEETVGIPEETEAVCAAYVIEDEAGTAAPETESGEGAAEGEEEESSVKGENEASEGENKEGALEIDLAAWEEYIKEKLLPEVVKVLALATTVLSVLLPIIKKVRESADRFKGAADDVCKAVTGTSKNEKDISELKADINTMIKEFEEIRTLCREIEKIEKIGFGNSTELIEKGYAHEIEKIGEEAHEENEG